MVRLLFIAVVMGAMGAGAMAQTTKPSQSENIGAMQLRAQTAFDKGDYATALPLFMNLEKKLADKPDQLGPIQEKIRVCKKNLLKDPPKDLQNFLSQKPADNATPEKRKPHVRPKDGQVLELAIKDLGNFEYDAEKGGRKGRESAGGCEGAQWSQNSHARLHDSARSGRQHY